MARLEELLNEAYDAAKAAKREASDEAMREDLQEIEHKILYLLTGLETE